MILGISKDDLVSDLTGLGSATYWNFFKLL